MPNNNDLLPCPFCGEPPKLCEAPNAMKAIVYWVECNNYEGCPMVVCAHHQATPISAAKIWNERAK